MALVKGRSCAESCLDLLAIEVVHFYYNRQSAVPPARSIDALGGESALLILLGMQ
jgi:hypothetical protein